jgi:hypothetical protein
VGLFKSRKTPGVVTDEAAVVALLEGTGRVIHRLTVPAEQVNEMMSESKALSIFHDAVDVAEGWARLEVSGQLLPYSKIFCEGLSSIIFGLKEGDGSHVQKGADRIIRCAREMQQRLPDPMDQN